MSTTPDSEAAVRYPGGLVIGVTGGIACGKSEVGRLLARAGVYVRDADQVAHEVMSAPDGAAYAAIVERFGPDVLRDDGAIDRKALGARVFVDQAEREALNAIVHPEVRRIWRAWAAQVVRENQVAAIIVPLLYEVRAEGDMDVVLCVSASPTRVAQRLAKRGLTSDEMKQRIAAQWPLKEKEQRADYVVRNNGTRDELAQATREVLQRILAKEQNTHG